MWIIPTGLEELNIAFTPDFVVLHSRYSASGSQDRVLRGLLLGHPASAGFKASLDKNNLVL